MSRRTRTTRSLITIALAAGSLAIQAGRPGAGELDGIWNYATMTPLERPRDLAAKPVLTPAEAADYERQTIARQMATNNTAGPDWWDPGTRFLTDGRTSLIVDPPDGRVPAMTPEAQQRAAARTQARRARGPADGPEDRALNERCLNWSVAGPPMLPGVYNNNVQIIEAAGYVAIVSEMIHDARIVPMDGRAHGTVPKWMGDARGRWEGRTLVVDTVGFTEKTAFRGSGEHLHLVERFTRLDADTLEYRFTAEDPSTWTRPFTGMFPMKKTAGPIYEYACHEGNERSMVGMLRGARAEERAISR
ncbi:MAG TPA: hypothetical protein VGP77_11990 [Vicinamibacterales bacterium]|nr:hypothetical protein [Vicinamibacterales bacterium]